MGQRVKYFDIFKCILFVLFSSWILLQFLAPIFLPEDSIRDLSGHVAIYDNKDIINNMNFPWNFVYSIGDILCHQKADRSFFINGNQMSFCSRCTGIWLGLTVGLGIMVFYMLKLDEKILFFIILGIIPLGIDGLGQLAGLWESINLTRLITSILAGFVCGVAIGIIIDEFREISINAKFFRTK